MMPLMSGAMQTLRRVQVAKASTSLNIIQQVGASIGTAVLSVILTAQVQDRFGEQAGGAGEAAGALPPQVADTLAEAYGATYWWAAALIVPALLAALLLPRTKPEPIEDEEGGAGEPAPVLIHA
jgi:hypothetical protein